MERCPFAIKYGTTLATRCLLKAHEGQHVGKGLARFPSQRIHWFPGDRREFKTDRKDEFSWDQ